MKGKRNFVLALAVVLAALGVAAAVDAALARRSRLSPSQHAPAVCAVQRCGLPGH